MPILACDYHPFSKSRLLIQKLEKSVNGDCSARTVKLKRSTGP